MHARRRYDHHADLRIALEDAADLMLDALERHLESPLDAALLARVAKVARQRRDALARYEKLAGIDIRPGERMTLEDLAARAEVDGDVSESAVMP